MKYELKMTIYNLENTCFACPTQFQFVDIAGRNYYFRLRWGHWTLQDITDINNWKLLEQKKKKINNIGKKNILKSMLNVNKKAKK